MTHFFRNQFARIAIQFLNPDTFFVNLALDVTVGRAGNAQTYRTGSTVTGQTDDAYIVSEVFTTELRTKTYFMSFCQHFFLQFYIAESTTVFITCSGQFIVVMGRSQFHGQQILLSRSTADNESDVIRRTSSRPQRLHLLYKERNQRTGVQDSFGLLIQVSLVCRTATFGHAEEFIFHSLSSFDINLCGQVTLRVHLIVHVQWSILRITQILLGIRFVDTQ